MSGDGRGGQGAVIPARGKRPLGRRRVDPGFNPGCGSLISFRRFPCDIRPSSRRVRPIMPRDDGMALIRALLRTALAALPMSPHTIEDELGIGHGTLLRLLDGRMELKLRHMLQLCQL